MNKKERIDEFFSNENAEKYFERIINTKDSDLCWCDSSLLYKDCHKKNIDKELIPGRINNLFHKLTKKKMCLSPDKSNCTKNIIKAHSIQNSISLDSISENGLVYQFEIDWNNITDWDRFQTILPKKFGKSGASTFNGFCDYHDRELFKEIDTKPIIPTKEQGALLSIRSLAKEIYAKTTSGNTDHIIRELPNGGNPEMLAIAKEIYKTHQEGTNMSLENLGRHYIDYFHIYNNKEFHKINQLIIKLDSLPEVLCSGYCYPEYDMNGNKLQDYILDEEIDGISFEIFVSQNKGIIRLGWYDNSRHCKKIADSILSFSDIPNTIIRFVFGFFENSVFNISWFDSLSVSKKRGLMNLLMSNIGANKDMEFIFNDRKKYVNWNITDIIKEY